MARRRKPTTEVPPAESCPVVLALTEASRYDLSDGPVMVQMIWSRALDLTVFFLPSDFTPYPTDTPRPDWKIEVIFPSGGAPTPQVTVTGAVQALDADSPKVNLGRAVLATINHLGIDTWRLPPATFQVSKQQKGYAVSFLPPITYMVGVGPTVTIGNGALILLSEDLKRYQISPSM